MSILNVNTIQPIGSGTTVTVAATELKTSNFITVGTGASVTSPSANVLTLGTNSAERLRITSAGLIGIGTVSPSGPIHAHVASGTQRSYFEASAAHSFLRLKSGSTSYNSGLEFFSGASNIANVNGLGAGGLQFEVNGSERLRITSDGNVSIGSLTDDSIGSTTTLTIDRSSGNGQISFAANGTVRGRIFADNSTSDFRIGNPTSNDLMLYTNNLERLRIDSNGRQSFYTDGSLRMHLNATGLGVNTNTITGGRLIHAHNTGTGSAYFQSTNSNTGEGNSSGAVYGVSGTTCYAPWNYINGPIVFATNSSEKMRIHATGEVTKSSQPLAVIGTTQNNPTPSAGSIVQFDYAATNRGNHYNTSNYTFTCPVAGDYMVIFRHSRKGWCGDLDLQKNGTTHAYLELRETGLNGAGTPVPDWQAGSYSFIVPCAANDVLRWRVGAVYTSTGSGGYLLDGYNHIKYDAVTYYLIG